MPVAPVREAPVRPDLEGEVRFNVQWLPLHKVVVHNNSHNTFDEVIAVLMRAVPGMSLESAIGCTYEIHLTGAAVVYRSDEEDAETCAAQIRRIGVRVTVEPDA